MMLELAQRSRWRQRHIYYAEYGSSMAKMEIVVKEYLPLLLLDRHLCPDGMNIVGRWCSTPCTEANKKL